ncbi:hypothetical protein NFI96_018032 [Prochilodus magdalenae]|nr:hypothetical protein NFI96_018032 [Prochilodus magdalenae]
MTDVVISFVKALPGLSLPIPSSLEDYNYIHVLKQSLMEICPLQKEMESLSKEEQVSPKLQVYRRGQKPHLTLIKYKPSSVHVIVLVNAKNMIKAMVDAGRPSFSCVAHTLQLAVNEGLLAQRSVADAVTVGHGPQGQVACFNLPAHSAISPNQQPNVQLVPLIILIINAIKTKLLVFPCSLHISFYMPGTWIASLVHAFE